MSVKGFDIVSPKITLYYSGSLSHSTSFSIFLTVIYFIVILIITLLYCIEILSNKYKIILYYKTFLKDYGKISFNSTNFQHHLILVGNDGTLLNYNDREIRIIGVKMRESEALKLSDERNIDHWIYSECSPDQIPHDDPNSICIQQYFDHKEKKFFKYNEAGFIYPTIKGGFEYSNYVPYIILTRKFNIRNNTNENDKVNPPFKHNQNNDWHNFIPPKKKDILNFGSIKVKIRDSYISNEEHEEPIQNYVRTISCQLQSNVTSVTNLHFFPVLLNTFQGYIRKTMKNMFQFSIEEVSTTSFLGTESNIFSNIGVISFSLHNRANIYERGNIHITEVIAVISGISTILSGFLCFLNAFCNRYTTYHDFFNILKIHSRYDPITSHQVSNSQNCTESSFSFNRTKVLRPKTLVTTKNKDKWFSIFYVRKIYCKNVLKYYSTFGNEKIIRNLKLLRQKILSEERMVKMYLYYKCFEKFEFLEKPSLNPRTILSAASQKVFREKSDKVLHGPSLFVNPGNKIHQFPFS